MQIVVILTWILQGVIMFFDEFYFHRKRGLGKWESLGHPIDTFMFLLCFIYTLIYPADKIIPFCILAVASCLIITKDEFVHKHECETNEQWLHSVLFILHPISLMLLFFAWSEGFVQLIKVQAAIISLFLIYQVIYWNYWRQHAIKKAT